MAASVYLAIAGVGIACAILWLVFARSPWPFQVLKKTGTYRSAPLPKGDDLEERKRDFARIVASHAKPGLFVVTPKAAVPAPWTSKPHGMAGDVSKEVADAVFEEFSAWLAAETKAPSEKLAERVTALVAVSEGFTFAMKHKFPPMFPQSRFVLVLGAGGEVRVAWLAYVTNTVEANLQSSPWVLKLLTEDVNCAKAVSGAVSAGVDMDYAVAHTSEKDIDRYIQQQHTASLSRAALTGSWDDFLGSK